MRVRSARIAADVRYMAAPGSRVSGNLAWRVAIMAMSASAAVVMSAEEMNAWGVGVAAAREPLRPQLNADKAAITRKTSCLMTRR